MSVEEFEAAAKLGCHFRLKRGARFNLSATGYPATIRKIRLASVRFGGVHVYINDAIVLQHYITNEDLQHLEIKP